MTGEGNDREGPTEVRLLTSADVDVLRSVAPDVFDNPIHLERAAEFLSDPRHHLVVALEDGVVIGFVSAIDYLHPDKPKPEIWVNELAVGPPWRRRGVATALMRELLAHAKRIGCRNAWVATEVVNEGAIALYEALGGAAKKDRAVVFDFDTKGGAASAGD